MDKKEINKFKIKPGDYVMKDKDGGVLYVGKAKNLKKRLASYFNKQEQPPKTMALVQRIHKIDTIVVSNEIEAFILENELIKKYRPPFNIIMRDDKGYLYIRITTNEDFPQILLARKVAKDGARYFGPYASSGTVHEVLKLIKRVFPLCTGKPVSPSAGSGSLVRGRACMNYHLKICPGVCIGKVGAKEYRRTIEQVARFLQGNYPLVIQGLKKQMAELSNRKEFERAARIRDGLKAIEAINERQSVVRADLSVSEDAIGVARQLNKALVVLLQVRSGALINQQQYTIGTKYETSSDEILSGFLRDYYTEAANFPKRVLLPVPISDAKVFTKWLTGLAGHKMILSVPTKGRPRAIVRLAQSNAEMKFQQISSRWQLEKLVATVGVSTLKQILKLKKLERIEAYDISNTQGTDAVGSMVVFEDGKIDKQQYRRFKIESVSGPDDFASLAEVLQRRVKHKRGDAKFTKLPDLILIDGGKGQVSTVKKAIGDKIKIIGIAKGDHSASKAKDDLVVDGKTIILPNNSPAKVLVQRIRDEAHRFALSYHTTLRRKHMKVSGLDSIPGVGPTTRKKLIKAFGSLAAIKNASQQELAKVTGAKLAKEILTHL